MGETYLRNGGRRIELFVPVEWNKATFDHVELRPVTLNDVVRWTGGEFGSAIALLASLAGMPEQKLKAITYPDMDRVNSAFLSMLPDPIRNDIASGSAPRPAMQPAEEPAFANGGGEPVMAPPLPESTTEENTTGFDARP